MAVSVCGARRQASTATNYSQQRGWTHGPAHAVGTAERRVNMDLIWIIIVVLVVLALLGYFGFGRRRGL